MTEGRVPARQGHQSPYQALKAVRQLLQAGSMRITKIRRWPLTMTVATVGVAVHQEDSNDISDAGLRAGPAGLARPGLKE